MHLFTRTGVLGGDPDASMAWAAKIGTHVAETTGRQLTTWWAGYGFPVGTVVWASWVEGHADVEKAFGGLGADSAYQALVAEGQAFQTAPYQDDLRQVIFGGPTEGDELPPLGATASVTTAVAAAGKYAEAMAWGAEMAALAASVTGSPETFMSDVFGTFGQVTWLGGAADAAATDAASEAISGSAEYMEMLGRSGGLFEPSSGHNALYYRIG